MRKRLVAITIATTVLALTPLAVSAIQNIFIASNKVSDVQFGSTPVNQVFVGDKLVWERYEAMQNYTPQKCAALSPGEIVELRDKRDDTIYRVKKMIDGNCWMIDNLAYDLADTSAPVYTSTSGTGAQLVSGTDTSVRTRAQYAQRNNTEGLIPNGDSPKASYLYNWCAALGDISSNCSASSGTAQYNTIINGARNTTGTATYQPSNTGICPAPFRLPKGGPSPNNRDPASTAGEFVKLGYAMGGNGLSGSSENFYAKITTLPASDPTGEYWGGFLGGVYNSGFNTGVASIIKSGLWWASAAATGGNGYSLFARITDSSVDILTGANSPKTWGGSVRCVLAPPPPPPTLTDVGTMQEVTPEICERTALGVIAHLRDTRDNTVYKVRKMPDGKCWMIDNLAYNINSAPAIGKPAYASTPEFDSTPNGTPDLTSVDTKPQYALNTADYYVSDNNKRKVSYLYNWCAALGDISTNCSASSGATQNQTVLDGTTTATTGYTATNQPAVIGICPAPFHLPKGGPAATNSDPSSTAAELAKLDIALGGTGAGRTNANTYSLITGEDTVTTGTTWQGVLGGQYFSGLSAQGDYGNWWSSTARDGFSGYGQLIMTPNTAVYPSNSMNKGLGAGVRCVL